MSLDLAKKSGTTSAGSQGSPLTDLTATALNDGALAESLALNTRVKIFVDTSGGDLAINSAAIGALTGLAEGDAFTYIKTTTDSNKVTFTDPDGNAYAFVDRQTEYMTVHWNGTALDL